MRPVAKKKKQKLIKHRVVIPREFLEEHINIRKFSIIKTHFFTEYSITFNEVFEKIV